MFKEILIQAWIALRRNPTRATLTMCGIMWGVVSVALLFAYGSGFRAQLVRGFDAFGKSAVVVWPGQTSDQAGGEKAGKRVRFELEDFNNIRAEGTLVRHLSRRPCSATMSATSCAGRAPPFAAFTLLTARSATKCPARAMD